MKISSSYLDIFKPFTNTKQIILIAFTAATYAGILIPFKAIQLVPGVTEIRPASAIPVLFGILFGPAAAWGSAFGNLIGDFFGTLTLGSIGGFIGNFLYSYVAWMLWDIWVVRPLKNKQENIYNISIGWREAFIFIVISIIASFVCAITIGIIANWFGIAPFGTLFTIIFINNTLASTILGVILLKLLYARVYKFLN